MISWIEAKQKEYRRFFSFANCDNARPEQNDKLRQKTNLIIYEEKPGVEDSIALVRSVINYDRLCVSEKCVHTLQEYATYRYPSEDERLKSMVKADSPIKENDDCMDASRYGLFTHITTFNKGTNFAYQF